MCISNDIELLQEQPNKTEKSIDGSIYGQRCSKTLEADWYFYTGSASSGALSGAYKLTIIAQTLHRQKLQSLGYTIAVDSIRISLFVSRIWLRYP